MQLVNKMCLCTMHHMTQTQVEAAVNQTLQALFLFGCGGHTNHDALRLHFMLELLDQTAWRENAES